MEAKKVSVKEQVSASKKLSKKEAKEIASASTRIIVSKGKKVQEFKGGPKADKDLLDAMVGTTGNLRAPLVRVGKLTLVGFNADVYEETFG